MCVYWITCFTKVCKNKAVILNHWFIIYHIENMIFNYWCLVKCWLVVPQAWVSDDYRLSRQVIYYDTVICFSISNDSIVFSNINNPDFILGNKHPFWMHSTNALYTDFLISLQKCFNVSLLICQYLLICHFLFVLMPHQFINSLQVNLSYMFSCFPRSVFKYNL